ncbi:hypothetical protein DdX_20576 [Ditylenchus destructor]|uniref:Uncharacterized protein n=1 Tax=Ditylenchus destructor TaxID=166010 RepID=A0AAD4QW90_9BILA|nr:hypothetical protein DdX_20576 [Ditylenchus destructor]
MTDARGVARGARSLHLYRLAVHARRHLRDRDRADPAASRVAARDRRDLANRRHRGRTLDRLVRGSTLRLLTDRGRQGLGATRDRSGLGGTDRHALPGRGAGAAAHRRGDHARSWIGAAPV